MKYNAFLINLAHYGFLPKQLRYKNVYLAKDKVFDLNDSILRIMSAEHKITLNKFSSLERNLRKRKGKNTDMMILFFLQSVDHVLPLKRC